MSALRRFGILVCAVAELMLAHSFFANCIKPGLDTVGFISMAEASPSFLNRYPVIIINNSPYVENLSVCRDFRNIFFLDIKAVRYIRYIGKPDHERTRSDNVIAWFDVRKLDVKFSPPGLNIHYAMNDPSNSASWKIPSIGEFSFSDDRGTMNVFETDAIYSNEGALYRSSHVGLTAEVFGLFKNGFCRCFGVLVSADQEPNLNGGDENQSARKNSKSQSIICELIVCRLGWRYLWGFLGGMVLGALLVVVFAPLRDANPAQHAKNDDRKG